MTSRELSDRKTARSLGLAEVLDMEDRRSEEQYQCAVCKTFCYLSQVVCQCSTKAVCVEHADLLCDHNLPHLTLRKRFSDNDLLSTQSRVAERAAIPTQWKEKLDRILEDGHSPPLRALRALVAEGDRINYPLPELQVLRKFVARANEWVESANVFIVRKQSRKRARRTRGRLSSIEPMANGVDDSVEKPERGLAELYDLIRDIQDLGFDCPEIAILHAQAAKAEAARGKARAILDAPELPENDRDGFIQECERLLLDGSSLNVHIDELVDIERIVLREQLIRELEEKLEGGISPTLEEVRHLLARARACELASDNRYLGLLEARQRAGDDWEKRATAVLNKSTKTIEELSDFANIDLTIPIEPTILDRLKSALAKAKDFEKQAKIWLQPSGGKPRVQEVLKLIGRSEKDFAIPAIQDLKRTADIAADLETRCEGVLKRKFAPTDEGDVFETMERWRAYAKEHLMMFSLPTFGRFDLQLTQHYAWIKGLPWYCDHHCALHSDGMLEDVLESTRPEDDLPPADEYFTCICTTAVRPPSAGKLSDAVQCDHCFARFHGVCAANGGSCPFCDHHHWNGSIHKERGWHFCYLPVLLHAAPDLTKNYCEEWKQMEIVVHRVDRLSAVIGQFLSFASQAGNQRLDLIPQVRHYMRKLYKIQFAVSPVPDVSFGLDLAGLHRILAGQPPVRAKKRRRPRFVFGQDVDKDWLDKTRCICRGRTPYLLNYPTVECDQCNKLYHAGCVFFPLESSVPSPNNRFTCPLCCLRKNRTYPYSDVRVQHIGA
jgi:[histone H3]-trimethyl-L-lysine4 demethylase